MASQIASLSLDDARRLAVRSQLLDGTSGLPIGKEGAARAIERLGYVQIDTIAVVERAHHQTLRTRCPDYRPEMLDELLAVDRRVFEYWGHAASYLPMSDFRFYLPKMRRSPMGGYGKTWLAKNADVVRHVHERIRAEGPLSSKDFERPDGERGGAWWNWKPAKMALEVLLSRGELMVAERRNFQRIYDLTERVLPESVDVSVPKDGELNRFLVLRALGAYAVAGDREIRDHIHGASISEISAAIRDLVEAGEVVEVSVDGRGEEILYARPETLEEAGVASASERCVLLSPFDNLIIQRERTQRLFGFDYTLECYLPEAKRKYGYFVFPILFGDRLVGRLDPKADRKPSTLILRSLCFEPSFDASDAVLAALAETLARFARFNGCDRVAFEKVRPAGHKRTLKRLVTLALAEPA
jgi:uncharacterized protein YcaQ